MHPYEARADRYFWSRAVAKGFDPDTVATVPVPLIKAHQKVMSAGSCFAASLVPHIERSGLHYIRTSPRHPDFATTTPENLAYDTYSAAYGNIYTARHLLQLVMRCLGKFQPREDRWHDEDGVRDPFRPGLRYFARSDREFDLLTRQYLDTVLAALRSCDVFIFTLGLTEAWRSKMDGAILPACPGTVAGSFDPARHEFVNFTVGEIAEDLHAFASTMTAFNPDIRIVLTVSPVPLVATASSQHVLAANSYSKSALRAAAEQVVNAAQNVVYFPSYEIVTGPQAPKDFFTEDRRNVSPEAVELVMSLFLSRCERQTWEGTSNGDILGERPALESRPMAALSDRIASLECEEAGQEKT